MKIKVIYELGVLGEVYKKSQTGIFRVAFELLKQLYACPEIKLFQANSGHRYSRCVTQDIHTFLKDQHWDIPAAINRDRYKFLPFRKEKLFKYLYRQIGISDYYFTYDTEILTEAQIYHSAYYSIPPIMTKYPHIKKVITIHDLIPILFPQLNANTEMLKETIASAGKEGYFICVSENTKKDLLQYAPEIPENHVFVSVLAASKEKFYPCLNAEKFSALQQKYNLPSRYFLSLSTLEPRKNIPHVIRCFADYINKNAVEELALVLVGEKGWDYDYIFEEYEKVPQLKNRIIFTGRVPDDDLASIYSHAQAFFYLSLYEGFGLPPLEAMQCGVPVVTSNTSSLPEVVGDAGITLDPGDETSLIQTMRNLNEDAALRKEYASKSLQRAQMFSWEKTLETHLQIYQEILKS